MAPINSCRLQGHLSMMNVGMISINNNLGKLLYLLEWNVSIWLLWWWWWWHWRWCILPELRWWRWNWILLFGVLVDISSLIHALQRVKFSSLKINLIPRSRGWFNYWWLKYSTKLYEKMYVKCETFLRFLEGTT